jgi:hypothetical protein
MHLSPKALLVPAILLVIPASLAQETPDSDHPEVMARLFYDIPEWLHREGRSTCASPFLTTEIIGLCGCRLWATANGYMAK